MNEITMEMDFVYNLKEVDELRCSVTNQLIKPRDSFYILPLQYFFQENSEDEHGNPLRLISLPQTISAKNDGAMHILISPLGKCVLIEKNIVSIPFQSNEYMDNPIFRKTFAKNKYVLEPTLKYMDGKDWIFDCLIFTRQSLEIFLNEHGLLLEDFIAHAYYYNWNNQEDGVQYFEHMIKFQEFKNKIASLLENRKIFSLADMNVIN